MDPDNQIQPVEDQPRGLDIPNLIGKLSPDQLHMLINYTNPISVIERLEKYGWTPDKETATVVAIAQDGENPKDQLQAIRFLRTLVKDALIASGQFIKAKRRLPYGPDGESVEFTTEFMLSDRLKDETKNTTEKATQNETIEGDNPNDKTEPKPKEDQSPEHQPDQPAESTPGGDIHTGEVPRAEQGDKQGESGGHSRGNGDSTESVECEHKAHSDQNRDNSSKGTGNGIQQHRPPASEHSEMFPGISSPGGANS